MEVKLYSPEDITLFKNKALQWAASFEAACYFDSNSYQDSYSAFDALIAADSESQIKSSVSGSFFALESFLDTHKGSWLAGFLGYDLKNQTEHLESSNPDFLNFPDLFVFKPRHIIKIQKTAAEIHSPEADKVLAEIESQIIKEKDAEYLIQIKNRFEFEDYIKTAEKIKAHILRGDIYEMNFCQEFYSENASIDPLNAFRKLNAISPTPFAAFFKLKNNYILSASPERFLSKRGNKLITQPIKGTARRGSTRQEDDELKESLRNNVKEQSENVMIVDLVRNDLTKCSVPGSVRVEELFGIYSFEQVHQMISTVVASANPQLDNAAIIKELFPMGSMTGAPKIRAMELIEEYEKTKRGIFSGAVGYFAPNGDFDFNVIIRSILYNSENKYLSFQAGSAVTFASDLALEYEECMIKAEAIRKVLA